MGATISIQSHVEFKLLNNVSVDFNFDHADVNYLGSCNVSDTLKLLRESEKEIIELMALCGLKFDREIECIPIWFRFGADDNSTVDTKDVINMKNVRLLRAMLEDPNFDRVTYRRVVDRIMKAILILYDATKMLINFIDLISRKQSQKGGDDGGYW